MKTFKIDPSATSSHGSTDLTSLSSISYDRQSDETVLGADGKPFAQGAYYDNISYVVTVNGYDNTIALGDSPETLVLKGAERENGSGSTGSITLTFKNACLSNQTSTINHAGNSEVVYTFRCVSDDGDEDPLAIT